MELTQVYEQPPSKLPSLKLAGTTLKPAMYSWRVDGRLVVNQPPSDGQVDVNDIDGTLQVLNLVLLTHVRPARVRMLIYAASSTGHGVSSDRSSAREIDCRRVAQELSVVDNGTSQGISFDRPTGATPVVVLQVDYASFEPDDISEEIASYVESWVLDI